MNTQESKEMVVVAVEIKGFGCRNEMRCKRGGAKDPNVQVETQLLIGDTHHVPYSSFRDCSSSAL